jgi:hypothetical protein
MPADTSCAVCGKPLDLWTATAALDGRTVCASGCFGAHLATVPAEDREALAAPTVSPPLSLPTGPVTFPPPPEPQPEPDDDDRLHRSGLWFTDDDQVRGRRPIALSDPRLAVPCWRCLALAGSKCRNYRGQNKQTCPTRGQPRPPENLDDADRSGSLFAPDLPEAPQ